MGDQAGSIKVALSGDQGGEVGAVSVHHVELGDAAAIADEDNALTSLRVQVGEVAPPFLKKSEAFWAAVRVADVKVRRALHGRGEHELRAVRRPCGSAVSTTEAREGHNLAGIDRVHADLRVYDAVQWLIASEAMREASGTKGA